MNFSTTLLLVYCIFFLFVFLPIRKEYDQLVADRDMLLIVLWHELDEDIMTELVCGAIPPARLGFVLRVRKLDHLVELVEEGNRKVLRINKLAIWIGEKKYPFFEETLVDYFKALNYVR